MKRLVFTWCSQAGESFRATARELFPDYALVFKPCGFHASGPTVYVALTEAEVARYNAWFSGLCVRVRAVLRNHPLEPGAVVYLPVSFNSWVIVGDGSASLGAALEAAAHLPVETAVLPAFPPEDVPVVQESLASEHERWQDRVRRVQGA